jgi:hypothetical protein
MGVKIWFPSSGRSPGSPCSHQTHSSSYILYPHKYFPVFQFSKSCHIQGTEEKQVPARYDIDGRLRICFCLYTQAPLQQANHQETCSNHTVGESSTRDPACSNHIVWSCGPSLTPISYALCIICEGRSGCSASQAPLRRS